MNRSYRGSESSSYNGRMPRGAGAYPRENVPVALRDDCIHLVPRDEYYRVEMVEQQPGVPVLEDGVTVADGGTEENVKLENLEMENGVLGQHRMVSPGQDIPDDVTIEVDYGGDHAAAYNTRNVRGQITNETGTTLGWDGDNNQTFQADRVDTSLLEWYILENIEVPRFTFTNNSGSPVTIQDIRFEGYAYVIEEISDPGDKVPVTLPVRRITTGP